MEANLKWVINVTTRIKLWLNTLPMSIVASKKYRDFKPQLDSFIKEIPVSIYNCLGLIHRIKIYILQVTKTVLRCMQPKYRRMDRSDTYARSNFMNLWVDWTSDPHSLSTFFFSLPLFSRRKLLCCSVCQSREGLERAGSVLKHIWSSCSLY